MTVVCSPYFLAVTSRDLRRRKKRWHEEGKGGRHAAAPTLHRPRDIDDPQSGQIVLIDERGVVSHVLSADGVQGLLELPNGRLAYALHAEIRWFNPTDASSGLLCSEPFFNDLHSLRLSSHESVMVAVSGTDTLAEVSTHSGALIWRWAAYEHGFNRDSFGTERSITPIDHRRMVYDTWLHTTHLNSAIRCSDGGVLCTLFHQGSVLRVDIESGGWTEIQRGFQRPHALREGTDGRITLCDTGAGRLWVAPSDKPDAGFQELFRLDVEWLQDCRQTEYGWLAVDGAQSRVLHLDPSGDLMRIDQFDEDWYLYESAGLGASSALDD